MSNLNQAEINKYGKVAVVMGGWSAEREISLMSGQQVLQALQSSGVNAHAVDADRNVISTLKEGGFERVFNILHGRGGEDGEIQGALQLAGIPYTGSGVLGSALAMNKLKSKEVCQTRSIPTPRWFEVTSLEQCQKAADQFGLPLVLKPVLEGSSIGVSIVRQEADLENAWLEAEKYGTVMVEEFIDGIEVTAGILGGEALPLVSMSTDREFYDYHAKYFDDDTQYLCPCGLKPELEREIQLIALQVFEALSGFGWGRADFMLSHDNKPYFIELNTCPGMTTHSLVPMAAKQVGIDFESLCLTILDGSFGEGNECKVTHHRA